MVKVFAVTVCVNRVDTLKECLPNLNHLEDWIIVTAPTDEETIEFCQSHGVHFHITHRLHEAGYYYEMVTPTKTSKVPKWHDRAVFNKGKAINEGLNFLPQEGFHLVMDADIILPEGIHESIKQSKPKPHQLFGMDRVICPTIEDYHRIKKEGWEDLPIYGGLRGSKKQAFMEEHYNKPYYHRVASSGDGYFQLFHGTEGYRYSELFSSRFADTRGFSQKYWKHVPWHRKKLKLDQSGKREWLTCYHLGNAFVPWEKKTKENITP